MFIESEFTWWVEVKPHQLKSVWHTQRALIRSVLRKFDSQCTEEHGAFVAVTSIESLGDGKVKEGTGAVIYPVCFRGITFKPFEDERVYATVTTVTEEHVMATFGAGSPLYVKNSDEVIGGYSFDKEEKKYVHSDGSVIVQGSVIRVKVASFVWFESSKMFLTNGSFKGQFLGVLQMPTKASGGRKGKEPV